MSFNQNIYDSNDIAIAIDKLIAEAVEKALSEQADEFDMQMDDLRQELDEARNTIDELRTEIDDLQEQLNDE